MPFNMENSLADMEMNADLSHEEQLGYEARANGLEKDHNPHKQGTPEYIAWWVGWNKANPQKQREHAGELPEK